MSIAAGFNIQLQLCVIPRPARNLCRQLRFELLAFRTSDRRVTSRARQLTSERRDQVVWRFPDSAMRR